ncbi:MAG: hypothetical protein RLN88_14460 [Ekhidna sp.]|uniref:hypothetical protein n=1 Tax=Ekhidna sp. TaxID=2608089 RepID=UPI0032ED0D15
MKNVKKVAYDIVMGILPVMIGVYLGIYFNNRNEATQQERLKQRIIESLLVEATSNKSELERSVSYFSLLRDSTEYLIRNDLPYRQFGFWEGLNPPKMNNTAFETAQITNVLPDISIDLLQALSKTYSSIEDVDNLSNEYSLSVTDKIGTSDFSNDKYLVILSNYSYDILVAEKLAIEELGSLIQLLERQSKKPK